MSNIVEQIVELVKELAKKEGHPDPVARLYAAQMLVTMRIGKEMLKIRLAQSKTGIIEPVAKEVSKLAAHIASQLNMEIP